MRVEDTIRLLDAGYTKEEILKMETQGTESAGENERTEHEKSEEQSKGDPEHESAVTENNQIFNELTASIKELRETVSKMQSANIKGAEGGKPEDKTVEDVMKSFIENM